MATRQYNIARGGSRLPGAVTEAVGGAISSGAIQLTIDLAPNLTEREVAAALQLLQDYIRRPGGKWPPA
jgi:hypothetical protein